MDKRYKDMTVYDMMNEGTVSRAEHYGKKLWIAYKDARDATSNLNGLIDGSHPEELNDANTASNMKTFKAIEVGAKKLERLGKNLK